MTSVSSFSEFLNVDTTETIELTTDIEAPEEFEPIEEFEGKIDGNGYSVKNIQNPLIKKVTSDALIENITFQVKGLSSNLNSFTTALIFECYGELRNVTMEGSIVDTSQVAFIDRLAGKIIDCSFYGHLKSERSCAGIAFTVENGYIKDSVFKGSLFGDTTYSISSKIYESSKISGTDSYITTGGRNFMGFVSVNEDSSIKNCHCNGTVFAKFVSGFVKENKNSLITGCDCKLNISGTDINGFAKINSKQSEIINVNCNLDISHASKKLKDKDIDVSEYDTYFVLENKGAIKNSNITATCDSDMFLYSTPSTGKFENNSINIDATIFEDTYTEEKEHDEITYTVIKEQSTIEVTSESDLKHVHPSATVKLQSDIVLSKSFSTIPEFRGVIDGNGHTIYNINKPLVGVMVNATIKNINFRDSKLKNRCFDNLGLICRKGSGEFYNISIANCSIKCCGDVLGRNIGSIISNFEGGVIKNCQFKGEIHGIGRTGGLAGYTSSSATCKITDCEADGSIFVKNDSSTGGIIGEASYIKIKNCINKSSINGENVVGGIVGGIVLGTNSIQGCVNKADISGTTDIGGIGGSVKAEVRQCTNYGDITGEERIGSVVGVNEESLKKCVNKGDVTGVDTIGGIVGRNKGEVLKSVSKSTVKGESVIGAICGDTADSTKVQNIYVKGTVISEESQIKHNGGRIQSFLFNVRQGFDLTFDNIYWDIEFNGTYEVAEEIGSQQKDCSLEQMKLFLSF